MFCYSKLFVLWKTQMSTHCLHFTQYFQLYFLPWYGSYLGDILLKHAKSLAQPNLLYTNHI